MAFTISEITANDADISAMTDIYRSAFSRDVLHEATIPSTIVSAASERAWLATRFRSAFVRPGLRHFKITEDATGRIAAFCRWSYPHVMTAEEVEVKSKADAEKKAATFPEGTNVVLLTAFFDALGEMEKKWFDAETQYGVLLLACHPDFQGKGLATKLLRHGLDRADQEGRKTYIEGSVAGQSLYRKLGWVDIDLLDIEEKGKHFYNWIMMRDPVKQ